MNRNSMGTRTLHMDTKPRKATKQDWRRYLYAPQKAAAKREGAALRRREVFDSRMRSGSAPAWNTYTALRAEDTLAQSLVNRSY